MLCSRNSRTAIQFQSNNEHQYLKACGTEIQCRWDEAGLKLYLTILCSAMCQCQKEGWSERLHYPKRKSESRLCQKVSWIVKRYSRQLMCAKAGTLCLEKMKILNSRLRRADVLAATHSLMERQT